VSHDGEMTDKGYINERASWLVALVLLPFCTMTYPPNGLDARLKKQSKSH
jgi:hypothetical protein